MIVSCAVEKIQTEPGNCIPLMDGFATVSLELLIENVGKQLDQQVDFIGGKVARRNPIDGKAALGFFDVILHASTLVPTFRTSRFGPG